MHDANVVEGAGSASAGSPVAVYYALTFPYQIADLKSGKSASRHIRLLVAEDTNQDPSERSQPVAQLQPSVWLPLVVLVGVLSFVPCVIISAGMAMHMWNIPGWRGEVLAWSPSLLIVSMISGWISERWHSRVFLITGASLAVPVIAALAMWLLFDS